MGCDYYIQTELVIEYKDNTGRINTIYTNRKLEKGYIYFYENQDSDDDDETDHEKYKAELERLIKNNTYNKILFENGKWVKESYKGKYETYLRKTFKDIHEFLKVYKKNKAWERE
jgi:hypothetical protein